MINYTAPCRYTRGGPEPGDIWWVEGLEFPNADGKKDRPVLIISAYGKSVVFCKCTSKCSPYRERYRIMDDVTAGLDRVTYVDPERFSMSKSRLSFRMGRLSEEDWEEVKK